METVSSKPEAIRAIDSHTEGEPTRIILSGGPDLGGGSLAERLDRFRGQHDTFRSSVCNEPRGWDAMVGGLVCPPQDASATTGIIFFNNVGYLGMCVHGTIGLVVTLAHVGRIAAGEHRIETPVGPVFATLQASGAVSVRNVPSYRHLKQVPVEVPRLGTVHGDVAWGGNWFFLVDDHRQELSLSNVDQLTAVSWQIREALKQQGVTGRNAQEIDHIELFGPPGRPDADSRNFVLCPGKAYDRSPCGTGTSAKLACLFADGKLREGESWRQESIVGSLFVGSVVAADSGVVPTVSGNAYVTAESTLIVDPSDPFATGI